MSTASEQIKAEYLAWFRNQAGLELGPNFSLKEIKSLFNTLIAVVDSVQINAPQYDDSFSLNQSLGETIQIKIN